MTSQDILLLLSGSGLVYWLAGLRFPRLFGGVALQLAGAQKTRSRWVRRKTRSWLQKWVARTLPLVLLLGLVGLRQFNLLFWALPPVAYAIAAALYKARLNRQYDLWQQLGYDGPPALEEQETTLLKRNHATPS